jgi:hypothetical protein
MTPRHPCQQCFTQERELGRVVCRDCLDAIMVRLKPRCGMDQRALPDDEERINAAREAWRRVVEGRR